MAIGNVNICPQCGAPNDCCLLRDTSDHRQHCVDKDSLAKHRVDKHGLDKHSDSSIDLPCWCFAINVKGMHDSAGGDAVDPERAKQSNANSCLCRRCLLKLANTE